MVQAALALGGAVGTKHSALVAVAVVLGLALFEVLRERAEGPTRRRRAAAAAFVLVGAWVFLWGLYGFRFRESGDAGDTFNRPLASKLDDVGSPLVRESLRAAERWRLLPASLHLGAGRRHARGRRGEELPVLRVREASVRRRRPGTSRQSSA